MLKAPYNTFFNTLSQLMAPPRKMSIVSKLNEMSGKLKLDVGKCTWRELIGINGDAATQIIMKENPRVKAFTVPEGSSVTIDFRCDRVRVFVNYKNIDIRVLNIG